MTHLTQIKIDFATAVRLRLRNCYDWHQAVWKAFPGRNGRRRDFLTRLDRRRDGFQLLIVSPIEPRRPDWCTLESWQSKPIPDTYFSRRRYLFQLYANPTKKIKNLGADGQPTKNGQRLPLRAREEYVGWINRKGRQGGFAVDTDSLRTFFAWQGIFSKS